MTRRDCVLSLAGGLCLSLVPACSHTASQVAAEPLALPLKSAGETGSQKPVTAAASPDGSLPGNAGDTNSRLKDSQIEQVRYPARSMNREFVPEPPRLSEIQLPCMKADCLLLTLCERPAVGVGQHESI